MKRIAALLLCLVLAIFPTAPALAQATDTTSPLLRLLLMGSGLHPNDWGSQTNTNLTKVENAIAGVSSFSVTGSPLTLTDDQARPAVLSFSGTLVANQVVTVPARTKLWVVVNATSGAFTLSLKTAAGSPVVVAQSATVIHLFYCDGTNIYDVSSDGLPVLTTNTVLANLGAGTVAATLDQFKVAAALDATASPPFAQPQVVGAAGTARSVVFRTTTAAGPPPVYSTRWTVGADSTAEGGSNAGSDFQACALADDGTTTLGCWLKVTRATGALTATGGPWTINGPVTITNGPLTVGGVAQSTPAEGFYRGLQITVTSDTAMTVKADSLTLIDASNNVKAFRGLNSVGVSTACSGAVKCMDTGGPGTSRWLQVWAIGKADGTIDALLTASASPTVPSPLPTGFTYYARLGAVRIDGSARVVRSQQRGPFGRWIVQGSGSTPNLPVMASGVAGAPATPTWSAVAWAAFAPPTAVELDVVAVSGGASVIAAPNNAYGSNTSMTNPAPCQAAVGSAYLRSMCRFTIESSNIYWASDLASQGLFSAGWTDGL